MVTRKSDNNSNNSNNNNRPSHIRPKRVFKPSGKTSYKKTSNNDKTHHSEYNLIDSVTPERNVKRARLLTPTKPTAPTRLSYGNGRENNPTSSIMDQFASGRLVPNHSTIEDNDAILALLAGSESNDSESNSDSDSDNDSGGSIGTDQTEDVERTIASPGLLSADLPEDIIDDLILNDSEKGPKKNNWSSDDDTEIKLTREGLISNNSKGPLMAFDIISDPENEEGICSSIERSFITTDYANAPLFLPPLTDNEDNQRWDSDPDSDPDPDISDDENEESNLDWEDIAIEPTEVLSVGILPIERHISTMPETGNTILETDSSGSKAIRSINIMLDKPMLSKNGRSANSGAAPGLGGAVGVSKQDRQVRLFTHTLHLQCLMYYGFRRNQWLNSPRLQHRLKKKGVPKVLRKKCKKLWKHYHKYQNNVQKDPRAAEKLQALDSEFTTILIQFVSYFMKRFKVTHHGLRSYGYIQRQNLKSFGKEWTIIHQNDNDQEIYKTCESFIENALKFQGSRDTGAQIFVALLRSLGFETRLVFSLPVITHAFGKETFIKRTDMTKYEPKLPTEPTGTFSNRKENIARGSNARYTDDNPASDDDDDDDDNDDGSDSDSDNHAPPIKSLIDAERLFPVFWCEVYNPITRRFIPVDPLVLGHIDIYNAVDHADKFEPRGKFRLPGMDMKYVVAYENDGNTRNVTGRYLSSYVDKLSPPTRRQQRDTNTINSFMFFKRLMKLYTNSEKRTEALQREDEELIRIIERSRRAFNMEDGRFSDKVAAYKNHEKYVLLSGMHKNEVLRPSAKPLHRFKVISRGKIRTGTVFMLSDFQICRPERVWIHEGRNIKAGEKPVKVERIKPRTLKRIRENNAYETWAAAGDNDNDNESDDDSDNNNGSSSSRSPQHQGLYTYEQTELYQPPMIINGVLPRNEYGNYECFKPHMLPIGAVNLRQKGIKRVAKQLGIDCVELVVGFSFEARGQARPIFEGVMVLKEHETELVSAYEIEMEKMRQKGLEQRTEAALNRWRVYLVRLRLHRRLNKQYGSDSDNGESEEHVNENDDGNGNTQESELPDSDQPNISIDENQNPISEDELVIVHSETAKSTSTETIVISSDDDSDYEDNSDETDKKKVESFYPRSSPVSNEAKDDSDNEGGGFVLDDTIFPYIERESNTNNEGGGFTVPDDDD